MRIPSWKALVNGLLCAALYGSAALFAEPVNAQDAVQPIDPSQYSAPGDYPPPGYGGPGGPGGPGLDALPAYAGPGAPPPTAWPEVSPFEVQTRSQLYNANGVWEYDNYTGPRHKYKFGVDYIYGWGAKPGEQVLMGDPNAFIHSYPTDDTFPFPPFTRITNFDPLVSQPFGWWPARYTSMFGNMDHYGVRATYGWENYDNSEWQVSGFVLLKNEVVRDRFGQTPTDPNDIDLLVFRLPLNDGTPEGTNIPFDGTLRVDYDQIFTGADFDYWCAPFFEAKNAMLRMALGVKYLYVQETFNVQASDSGLDYTYTAADGAIDNIAILIDPFTSSFGARTTSNLVGPEIGLRADLGGDAFKVWGQVKTGALVNMDRTEVYGDNLRTQLDQFFNGRGPTTLNTRNHVHITPMFQTSIYGEFGFFSYLPILKSIPLVNLAKFRVGYDYVLLAEMARPAQAIRYNYEVLEVQTKRQLLGFSMVNFGLNWKW